MYILFLKGMKEGFLIYRCLMSSLFLDCPSGYVEELDAQELRRC